MSEESRPGRIAVRDAGPEDAEFLLDMLLEAYNWTGEERLSRKQLLRDRTASFYVAGWQRDGDLGVVAVDLGGPSGLQIPVGAAWLRRFTSAHPGYGYVADDVPELSMAVVRPYRGHGIGTGLVRAVGSRALEAGIARISLSVEDGNPAARLYRSLGFTTVGRNGNADTMVLDLASLGQAVGT